MDIISEEKFVCIEKWVDACNRRKICEVGKIYTLSLKKYKDWNENVDMVDIMDNGLYLFSTFESFKTLSNFFIPLVEWRDKQIKEILNG